MPSLARCFPLAGVSLLWMLLSCGCGGAPKHASHVRSVWLMGVDTLACGLLHQVNKATVNMMRRVEPYITWGHPNLKTVKELIYKRGYGKVRACCKPGVASCEPALGASALVVACGHFRVVGCMHCRAGSVLRGTLLAVQVNKSRIPLTDNAIIEQVRGFAPCFPNWPCSACLCMIAQQACWNKGTENAALKFFCLNETCCM